MKNCDHTVSNITCQGWNETYPHEPYYQPPENDREHNFCRNPDSDVKGPWCYTTDRVKRWEYCNLATCISPVEATSSVSTIDLETSTIPATSHTTKLSTNFTTRAYAESTLGFWYLYVIGAVALTILLTVVILIVIIKKKRGKEPNGGAVTETATISLYEDVPEGTLQRARENTYTEIPFFAGYLTGYDNLTASESSGNAESVVSGSTDDTSVYQNVANARPAIYESSEAGSSPKQNDQATYEMPTSVITEDSQKRSSLDTGSYSRQISTTQDDKRKCTGECNQETVTDEASCAIYRIPVTPKPIDEEDGYETPCVRRNGPVHRVTPLKKLPPSDSTTKMDGTMICISPKMIDNEWEYARVDEADFYSTPTSPVFPIRPDNERGYGFHAENGYANVEASTATPDNGKDEYCTMDNVPEQRKKSDKVVTLSRTYVTMHSAKAPKSLKELKKQLKLQGKNKRKTK